MGIAALVVGCKSRLQVFCEAGIVPFGLLPILRFRLRSSSYAVTRRRNKTGWQAFCLTGLPSRSSQRARIFVQRARCGFQLPSSLGYTVISCSASLRSPLHCRHLFRDWLGSSPLASPSQVPGRSLEPNTLRSRSPGVAAKRYKFRWIVCFPNSGICRQEKCDP